MPEAIPGEARLEGFIPIELLRDVPAAAEPRDGWADRSSLFGELEA